MSFGSSDKLSWLQHLARNPTPPQQIGPADTPVSFQSQISTLQQQPQKSSSSKTLSSKSKSKNFPPSPPMNTAFTVIEGIHEKSVSRQKLAMLNLILLPADIILAILIHVPGLKTQRQLLPYWFTVLRFEVRSPVSNYRLSEILHFPITFLSL